MPVGEAFLSAFLQVLFDRLASQDVLELATRWTIDPELKKLTVLASKINAVLEDAEEKQVKDVAVKLWLDEVQDLADDAEDLLDEFTTEILRCKLEAEKQNSSNLTDMFSYLNLVGTALFNQKVAAFKIGNIRKRFEDIAKQTVQLGLRKDVGEKSIGLGRRLPTTSLVDDHIYGREEDAKKMIDLLLRDANATDDRVCVIPLVGLGGIGKTTLAQMAYNDQKVNEHFEVKAWASVSGEFDLVKVTKAILESLGESCGHISNLEPLLNTLRKKLKSKKFLIVLDDLWDENPNEWDALQPALIAGARRSMVIVTTRNENVCQAVGNDPIFHLRELYEDDCWLLFAQHAFSSLNSAARPNLESIGKEIAKKCKGLPLAAKALGGLLRSNLDADEWQSILNSEVWELPDKKCGILPVLSLSYYNLPSHLKPCFAYCAIFPKGYEFDEEELVRLWIAEGLVQQPKGNMHLEEIGSQYFHNLNSRSLFQQSRENVSRFKMHDLINDLAQFAAGERCLRLQKGNLNKKHQKVRYLSYIRGRWDAFIRFEAFSSHKRLRTFLPLNGAFRNSQITIKLSDLLKTWSSLRVLSLSHYEISELPDLIGDLKYLRYLDLSNTLISRLPKSVARLFNLQTLILFDCHFLIELSTNMGDLVNLRHLDIRGCYLQQLPPHMGRLKDLRTLPYFFVSKDNGCGIMELKSMSNLQGDLCISRLENVDNDADAVNANLKDKKLLNRLELKWSSSVDDMQETGVLDALKPHRNLKELSIKHYSGTKFPIWTGNPYSNLMFLSVINCRNCSSLPPLGQLPSLRKLIIKGMGSVRRIDSEFYRGDCWAAKPFQLLEILKFKDMPLWEEWLSPGVGEFPCLQELCIENCPKFKEIPGSLASLKILNIHHSKELPYIPCLPQIQILVLEECDQVILESVANLTSLETLHLLKVLNRQCLPHELLHRLTALHDLKVDNCDELTILSSQDGSRYNSSFDEYGLAPYQFKCLEIVDCKNLKMLSHGLHSLQTLKIIDCPSLVALPEMDSSSNLRNLHIINCGALQSLPEGLMRNKDLSLEVLEIDNCFSFKCFPNGELPLTLMHLKISNCPALNFLPAGLQDKNICLESLQIIKCSLITSFPTTSSSLLPSTFGSSSSSNSNSSSRLKELEINDCMDLMSLPDALHNFVNLDKLLISSCPKLVSFPVGGLPPNLMSLSISKCEALQALPNQMHNLTSLIELDVYECSSLESFPEGGLPASLKSLRVKKCENLNSPSKWYLNELGSIINFDISNE